jgi:hypothetical protein
MFDHDEYLAIENVLIRLSVVTREQRKVDFLRKNRSARGGQRAIDHPEDWRVKH